MVTLARKDESAILMIKAITDSINVLSTQCLLAPNLQIGAGLVVSGAGDIDLGSTLSGDGLITTTGTVYSHGVMPTQMRLDKLGIGSILPAYAFNVDGNIRISSVAYFEGIVRIGPSNNATVPFQIASNGNEKVSLRSFGDAANHQQQISGYNIDTSYWQIWGGKDVSNLPFFAINCNGYNALRVNGNNGLVGVNTNSPQAPFCFNNGNAQVVFNSQNTQNVQNATVTNIFVFSTTTSNHTGLIIITAWASYGGFTDLVMGSDASDSVNVLSSWTQGGSPGARTYSWSGQYLRVSIASGGPYDVTAWGMGGALPD